MRTGWLRLLYLVGAALIAAACDRRPSPESLQEWSPNDHHSSDDDKLTTRGAPAQAAAATTREAPGASGADGSRAEGDDDARLVDLAWRQQCATCHGVSGHGDGPMAPMVHPTDFTSAEWQARVTDADMIAVIRNGKNRMPRFDLPEPVLRGLVARVRSFRGR